MQVLLIYKLVNKNHLKNINDQNFSHFMRGYEKGGYDKGFYGNTSIICLKVASIVIIRYH